MKKGDILICKNEHILNTNISPEFSMGDKCVVYKIGPVYEGGRKRVHIKNIVTECGVDLPIDLVKNYFITIVEHRTKIIENLI